MSKPPLLTPLLWWFMLAMVLANIAGAMSPLLLPLYLTELGASVGDVGLVFTVTSVAILALQIFGGWISDSVGRLRAIAIGGAGGVVGFAAMLLAPSWPWMLVALAIHQFPFALVGPSFGAFIAENSTEANRGRLYGLTGTIYQVTGIIGPPLGGFLAGAWGFKPMLAVAAALYTVATGLRIWMATTMRSPQERPPRPLSLASLRASLSLMAGLLVGGGVITWLFVTDGAADIAFRLSWELQPLYLEKIAGLTLAQIGWLGSLNAAAGMFVPLLSGRLADRYGERLPIAAGFLLIFTAFLVFLRAEAFLTFAVSWIIFGLGSSLLGPAYQSLLSKVVPAQMLGTFSGVFDSSRGFLSLPAPWLGAQLWERFSPRLPFMITAGAALLVLPPIWLKFKAPAPAAQPVGEPERPAAEPDSP